MNTTMKMALVKGILTGFAFAMLVIFARVFIGGIAFTEVVTSMYGILVLICIPAAWIFFFIAGAQKKTA